MKPMISRSVFSFLLLCLTFTAHAEIYKWTDADGKTHYSQTPPEDASTESKDIGDEIDMAAGTAQSNTPTEENVKPAAEDDDIAKAKKEGEANTVKHQAYCDQQHAALKQLLANPVIRWKSKDGEKILTSKERNKKISEIERSIKEMCNPDVLSGKKKTSDS